MRPFKPAMQRQFAFFIVFTLLPWLLYGLLLQQWDISDLLLRTSSAVLIAYPYLLLPGPQSRKWYWRIAGLVWLTWVLTESLYLLKDKTPFNYLALKLFAESFPKELIGYFTNVITPLQLLGGSALIIALLYAFLAIDHRRPAISGNLRRNWGVLALICAMVQFLSPISPHQEWGLFKNAYIAWKEVRHYYRSILKSPSQIEQSLQALQINYQPGPRVRVLLLGESTSRHHWGQYGYWRNTTPRLSSRTDIAWYTDVISSNTSTVESLGKCLTINANGDQTHNFSDVNIIDVANAADYRTYWISTHHRHGLLHSSVPESVTTAHVQSFLEEDFPGVSMPHDAYMLPYLEKALQDTFPRKLIMLHLMETHIIYQERYPPAFEWFTQTDTLEWRYPFANTHQKRAAINAYDNANYYQDRVLDTILQTLEAHRMRGVDISAVYLSDHGEEVYDYRDFLGHTPQSNAAWLHEIPFFTWGIDIDLHKNAPYTLQAFAHSCLDWLGIHCNAYQPQMSIFRPEMNVGPRRLGNGMPYVRTANPSGGAY